MAGAPIMPSHPSNVIYVYCSAQHLQYSVLCTDALPACCTLLVTIFTDTSEALLTRSACSRYLGGWPASLAMTPKGDPAILDCTCELPRMQRHLPYLNLPVWDTHGMHCSSTFHTRQPPSELLNAQARSQRRLAWSSFSTIKSPQWVYLPSHSASTFTPAAHQ